MAKYTYTENPSTPLPHQLTIDVWNNISLNKFLIWQNAHILRIHIPPNPFNNRSLEPITPFKLHIYQNEHILRIYLPLLQLTIYIWSTITPNMFHIEQNAHILKIHVPLTTPIDHRYMEYHYTILVSHIAHIADTSTPPLHTNWQ